MKTSKTPRTYPDLAALSPDALVEIIRDVYSPIARRRTAVQILQDRGHLVCGERLNDRQIEVVLSTVAPSREKPKPWFRRLFTSA